METLRNGEQKRGMGNVPSMLHGAPETAEVQRLTLNLAQLAAKLWHPPWPVAELKRHHARSLVQPKQNSTTGMPLAILHAGLALLSLAQHDRF